jgi:Domain of unknown function (DUF1876)
MAQAKKWAVEIFIDEHGDETHAEARLHTGDKTHLRGTGKARKNPADRSVPEIGDELAAARALSELAHNLLRAAADDIEAITNEHARVHP